LWHWPSCSSNKQPERTSWQHHKDTAPARAALPQRGRHRLSAGGTASARAARTVRRLRNTDQRQCFQCFQTVRGNRHAATLQPKRCNSCHDSDSHNSHKGFYNSDSHNMTRTVVTAIRAFTPCAGVWRLQNRSPGLSVRSDSRIAGRHGVSFCQQQRLRACTRVTRPGLAEPRRAARPRLDDSETRLKRATRDSATRAVSGPTSRLARVTTT
jgi:hypothetical protein